MLGACIAGGSLVAADLPQAEAQKIWDSQIKGNSTPRIFDNFKVIEGVPLIRLPEGIGPLTLGLTLTAYRAPKPGMAQFVLLNSLLCDMAERGKEYIVTREQYDALKPISDKAKQAYDASAPKQADGPKYVQDLRRVQATIQGAKDYDEALQKLAQIHGWVAVHEQSADCDFRKYKKAIDMRIPILLERENTLRVALGYLQVNGKDCLILADPAKLPEGPADPAKPDEPRKCSAAMEFIEGFAIEPFEKGRYTAHFIHSWEPSAEGYKAEIEKIIAEHPDEVQDKPNKPVPGTPRKIAGPVLVPER